MQALAALPRMEGYLPGETDDHAFLRRYREETPLALSPNGFPLALRFTSIDLLTDPNTTRQLETESLRAQGIHEGAIFDLFNTSMLFANGEAHMRRRSPISRTFAFKLMEAMRGEVNALARELVEARLGGGPVDYLEDFAGEIPARIIASVLGVSRDHMTEFRRLVYSVTRAFVLGMIRDNRAEIESDFVKLQAEIEDLLRDRRMEPKDDFLTSYLAAADERGDLSPDEIRWQVATLIVGGTDTTRLALCATLSHLVQRPDQWRAFCSDPQGLKRAVVQEGLRYEPPIGSFARVALQDIDLGGGAVLPQGVPCSISTLSAMRDGAVYADPDRFDVFRTDHPKWHPSFGAGAHRCLGEALARVELEESLAVIADLAPNTVLVGAPPNIYGVNGIRRIDRMEVSFA